MCCFVDVPPLEDLTEAVHRAKVLRAQSHPQSQPQPRGYSEARNGVTEDDSEVLKKHTRPKETRAKTASSFGGFSKGFLLSSPAASDTAKSSTSKRLKTKSNTAAHPPVDEDIPFLKAKTVKGPVLPEVQDAMKDAFPLLNTEGYNSQVVCVGVTWSVTLSSFCRMVD